MEMLACSGRGPALTAGGHMDCFLKRFTTPDHILFKQALARRS